MLDPTNVSTKPSASVLERPQRGMCTSITTGSGHFRSPSPVVHRCAACCTLFPLSEPSQNQSSLKLPRPLPIPPPFAHPSHSLSTQSLPTPSSSTSSVTSTSTPDNLSCRSHSLRPLPRMPSPAPSLLGTRGSNTYTNERQSPPASPADLSRSLSAPQQSPNSKELRRGNLSKLQPRSGKSTSTDLVPPKSDAEELSNGSSSDDKDYRNPPLAPIIPQCISEQPTVSPILEKITDEGSKKLARQYSRIWLREEKGRRWVEDDYHMIKQCLRELR